MNKPKSIDPSQLMRLVIRGRVRWHPTTPKRFRCQPGCSCCCLNTFFFPSEELSLPPEIRGRLVLQDGAFFPGLKAIRGQERCAFFTLGTPQHCSIFEHRPLRCRLYPFLPMIAGDEVVVVAEPFLDSSTTTFGFPKDAWDWVRCYGLGSGKSVRAEVEKMCLLFLHKVAREIPDYVAKLLVDDVDNHISKEWIRRHREPGYEYFYDYLPLDWYSKHKTPTL